MPSPSEYAPSARRRELFASAANVVPLAQVSTVTADTIRDASPSAEDAEPSGGIISRSGEGSFVPLSWMDAIAVNADELLARDGRGIRLYDELLDDDVVFSAFQQRRLAVIGKDWEVVAGDEEDPRSVQAAEDLKAMLAEVGFDNITDKMLYATWFGYAVGECEWTTKAHNGRLIYWLKNIVVPDRRHFGFTNGGELRLVAGSWGALSGEALPANKFWTIRTGASHDFAFYGLGLGHWAYWPIFFKRAAIKFWAIYLEKFGMPTVGIEFPAEEKDNKKAKAERLQAAIAVGQDRAVLLPQGTLSDNKLKLIEAERSGSGASSYRDFVSEQNEALMRIILGQPGTMKGVSSGLNSNQASEHAEVKAEIVQADSDLTTETFNRGPATWITHWNYGPDVAPPKVRRLLDDAEDLSKIAERDVALDGIGIKRTVESVRGTYGDGYEVDRVSEAEKARLAQEAAQARTLPAPANDDRADPRQRNTGAEFAARFNIEGKAPLYVSRKLVNAAEFLAWARGAGFKAPVPGTDLHVTVLYSKTPVDWFDMGSDWGTERDGGLRIRPGGPRTVERFGDDAIVLRFHSDDLAWRHRGMIDRGASSDYPTYKPHITISYGDADLDLDAIEAFDGELLFGPEIFEPIRTSDDPGNLDFSAADEEAIDRLAAALIEEGNPVFEAMAEELRGALQGVTTAEGARVALFEALDRLPVERMAALTALPMLAVRAANSVGAGGDLTA